MKYLVGTTTDGTAVFAVQGEKAINLTALNPAIGHDLMGLIQTPDLIESLTSQMQSHVVRWRWSFMLRKARQPGPQKM